jgi:RNA polymerase sigma factor (sigma-70 family)
MGSSRPGTGWPGSVTAPRSGPGSCASWPTRPATAAGRQAGARFAEDRASGGAAPSPEAAVLSADRRRIVGAALAGLPTRQRDVVACRYLVGLDEAETAAVLGLPRGTVKSRAARGLARLRDLLPERIEIGGTGNA